MFFCKTRIATYKGHAIFDLGENNQVQDKRDQVKKFYKLRKGLQTFEECVNFLIQAVRQQQSHQISYICHHRPEKLKNVSKI